MTTKNNIKWLREEAGLSQEKLAILANTTSQQIGRLEKSQRRLTQEWMQTLAKALGCHPSDLLPEFAPPKGALLQQLAQQKTKAGGMRESEIALGTARAQFLKHLGKLLKQGLITKKEYTDEKNRILKG
jgi:transcriptional regulator with XRE-family HTH domain